MYKILCLLNNDSPLDIVFSLFIQCIWKKKKCSYTASLIYKLFHWWNMAHNSDLCIINLTMVVSDVWGMRATGELVQPGEKRMHFKRLRGTSTSKGPCLGSAGLWTWPLHKHTSTPSSSEAFPFPSSFMDCFMLWALLSIDKKPTQGIRARHTSDSRFVPPIVFSLLPWIITSRILPNLSKSGLMPNHFTALPSHHLPCSMWECLHV